MGSWTDRYLLYMAAAGEMGYGERISGNFAKIEEVLGVNEDTLDTHRQSHDTDINGDVLVSADIIVPAPHVVQGKSVCDYVITPVRPLVDGTDIVVGTPGMIQIYQVPPGQTLSGSLPVRTNGNGVFPTITCVDVNMDVLATYTLTQTMVEYPIPTGTAGIYGSKGSAYTGVYIILGKFTVSP
ncbi:hypothetical protein O0S10_01795 [Methanocorpusculum sp. MG]|uniref:Uncharacterized protein n=1 Tax=Methanocorpusculum petauri TaxID=3002863 RepID=A0ABT4IDZ2_9EURY|nr:hypothetical protein [Methanocorpusculum petauri]MCZ0859960.1 hypothetical protein [Methanocorpusculum petauri]